MWKDRSKITKMTPKPWRSGTFRQGTPPPSQQFARAGWTQLPGIWPCPIPGSEDGVVYFNRNGVSAYWDEGKVYVKTS